MKVSLYLVLSSCIITTIAGPAARRDDFFTSRDDGGEDFDGFSENIGFGRYSRIHEFQDFRTFRSDEDFGGGRVYGGVGGFGGLGSGGELGGFGITGGTEGYRGIGGILEELGVRIDSERYGIDYGDSLESSNEGEKIIGFPVYRDSDYSKELLGYLFYKQRDLPDHSKKDDQSTEETPLCNNCPVSNQISSSVSHSDTTGTGLRRARTSAKIIQPKLISGNEFQGIEVETPSRKSEISIGHIKESDIESDRNFQANITEVNSVAAIDESANKAQNDFTGVNSSVVDTTSVKSEAMVGNTRISSSSSDSESEIDIKGEKAAAGSESQRVVIKAANVLGSEDRVNVPQTELSRGSATVVEFNARVFTSESGSDYQTINQEVGSVADDELNTKSAQTDFTGEPAPAGKIDPVLSEAVVRNSPAATSESGVESQIAIIEENSVTGSEVNKNEAQTHLTLAGRTASVVEITSALSRAAAKSVPISNLGSGVKSQSAVTEVGGVADSEYTKTQTELTGGTVPLVEVTQTQSGAVIGNVPVSTLKSGVGPQSVVTKVSDVTNSERNADVVQTDSKGRTASVIEITPSHFGATVKHVPISTSGRDVALHSAITEVSGVTGSEGKANVAQNELIGGTALIVENTQTQSGVAEGNAPGITEIGSVTGSERSVSVAQTEMRGRNSHVKEIPLPQSGTPITNAPISALVNGIKVKSDTKNGGSVIDSGSNIVIGKNSIIPKAFRIVIANLARNGVRAPRNNAKETVVENTNVATGRTANSILPVAKSLGEGATTLLSKASTGESTTDGTGGIHKLRSHAAKETNSIQRGNLRIITNDSGRKTGDINKSTINGSSGSMRSSVAPFVPSVRLAGGGSLGGAGDAREAHSDSGRERTRGRGNNVQIQNQSIVIKTPSGRGNNVGANSLVIPFESLLRIRNGIENALRKSSILNNFKGKIVFVDFNNLVQSRRLLR